MAKKKAETKVLVIDVGGSNIKMLMTGEESRIKIPSGSEMSAKEMVKRVKSATKEAGWDYDVISLGVPCVVRDGQVVKEPANLGTGWVDFDFAKAFACPLKLINDAAIQAYGCYKSGTMLFLGFGTGLGTALVVDRIIKSLCHAFCATDLVIGGGNAKDLEPFPKGAREVDNSAAFVGGFRLWEDR